MQKKAVCVSVCVCERERERESVCVCVFIHLSVYVCVCLSQCKHVIVVLGSGWPLHDCWFSARVTLALLTCFWGAE